MGARPRDRTWWRATLLILLALAGCAPIGAAPGQGPYAPYQRDNNDMHGGGDGGGSGM